MKKADLIKSLQQIKNTNPTIYSALDQFFDCLVELEKNIKDNRSEIKRLVKL